MTIRAVRRSESPGQSFELARALGELLRGGEVIALVGELGSGKTTFARGLICGLGCTYYRMVNSPTYVLERVYVGRFPIHHYDAYRLEDGRELQDAGFEEHLGGQRVLIVEWADRVASWLPADRLLVELEYAAGPISDSRCVALSGPSKRWESVFSVLEKNG